MIGKFHYIIIILFVTINCVVAQNNKVFSDTIVYSHSKYDNLNVGVLVKHFFLSEVDYNLVTSGETRFRSKENTLSKYKCHEHELFEVGSEFISPYALFGLVSNETEYDFVFPMATYYLNWHTFERFYLNDKFNISHSWRMNDPDFHFYSDEQLIAKLTVPFPMQKSEIEEYVSNATHFLVILSNSFGDQLQAVFHIKR